LLRVKISFHLKRYFEGKRLDPHQVTIFYKEISKKLASFHKMEISSIEKKAELFETIKTWIEKIDWEKEKNFDKNELLKEVNVLEGLLSKTKIVFSHNDLIGIQFF
jgi:hypothetical protein